MRFTTAPLISRVANPLASVALASTMIASAASSAVAGSPPAFELIYFTDFPLVHGPTRFALADLDGDGVLDGVFPGRNTGGRIYLMRGVGDGAFVDPIEIVVGSQSDWVEIVDIDGDGVLDLVLALRANQGRVAVLHGLGGFAFEEPVYTLIGREPRTVVVGDPGVDGHRDLFSIQYGESSLRALASTNGSPHVVTDHRLITAWSAGVALPQWLGRADVNGDGLEELWTLSTGSGSLSVFAGELGATIGPSRSWRMPKVGPENPGVSIGAIADITGDGALDLVTAGLCISEPQSLVVLHNDGSGGFTPAPSVPVTFNGLAWSVTAGDLDLDGDIDVLMTTALGGQVHVLENQGGGVFTHAQAIDLGTFVRHAWIDDVDGDCLPDIVAVDLPSNRIFVIRNVTPGLEPCGGVAEARNARGPVKLPARSAEELVRAETLAALVAHASLNGADAAVRVLADFDPSDGALMAPASEGGLASGTASCGPPAGPCNEPHGGPGCFTTPCCEAVCFFDPGCCSVAWDQDCVDYAQQLCGNLFCPSPGSCFEVHLTRGCDDAECCAIVSRLDGFCGSAIWDEICVLEALRFCVDPPCELTAPSPASIDEDEPCYKRFNQGCTGNTPAASQWIELSCGDARHGTSSTGAPRDSDWFHIELEEPSQFSFEVVTEFPARLLLLQGPCDGPLQQLDEVTASNCGSLTMNRLLPAGSYHLVLAVGVPERVITNGQPCDLVDPDGPPPDPKGPPFVPGRYGLDWQASLTCGSRALPGDVNGDGLVDGADLAIILGNWGPCRGCLADLDGNGIVDGADLAIVLGNWTG